MKKTLIIISILVVLSGIYVAMRISVQKRGWHKNKVLAGVFGVSHYSEEEADQIAQEFDDILS